MFPDWQKSIAFRGAVVAAACLVGVLSTQAAEYRIEPSINGRISYDSNLLLDADGSEIETFILALSPRLRSRMSTGKWQADFDGSITIERLEDDGFDSDNQNVSLQLTRRTETMLFQVAALNSRQSTRSIELDQLGEIGFQVERRDRQSLRPSVTWTLNPTNRLVFGVSWENIHYGGLDFSDYDYYSADIAWTNQFDEKTQFSVTAFGSDYSSGPPEPRINIFEGCPGFALFGILPLGALEEYDSDTVGLQIGASRQPTSRFSYRASVGYRNVDTTNKGTCIFGAPGQDRFSEASSSDGLVLDTGATYQGEKYGVDFSVSRSISPIGLGFLTELDSFNLDVSYRYSEQITLALLVNGFSNESLDEDLEFDRDGLRVTPRISWQLTEKLRLNGSLSFRSNKYLTVDGKREGTIALMGFDYKFKPTTFSR